MLRNTRAIRRTSIVLAAALALTAAGPADGGPKRREKRAEKAEKILAENYVPSGAWEAYFRDGNGRTYQLLQPVEQNPDKDWLGLTFTSYDGPKTRLAVMRVENKTAYGTAEIPLGSIEELLTTGLYRTSRFELIERKAVGGVLAEQNFGASGRVSQETAAAIGSVQGAQYLIYAAVNEWSAGKTRSKAGLGRWLKGPLGAVSGNKGTAEVAMSFRVVDSTSSQILFSTTERATAGSWGVGLAGFGGLAGHQKNAPINYAVHSCINKGVYKLARWLKDRDWRGAVVEVEGDKVYVNAGSDKGIETGMVLTCLAKGKELKDPTTGQSLGSTTEAIGSMQITAVNEKFSIAMIVQGCRGLKPGDFVEVEAGNGEDGSALRAGS